MYASHINTPIIAIAAGIKRKQILLCFHRVLTTRYGQSSWIYNVSGGGFLTSIHSKPKEDIAGNIYKWVFTIQTIERNLKKMVETSCISNPLCQST